MSRELATKIPATKIPGTGPGRARPKTMGLGARWRSVDRPTLRLQPCFETAARAEGRSQRKVDLGLTVRIDLAQAVEQVFGDTLAGAARVGAAKAHDDAVCIDWILRRERAHTRGNHAESCALSHAWMVDRLVV